MRRTYDRRADRFKRRDNPRTAARCIGNERATPSVLVEKRRCSMTRRYVARLTMLLAALAAAGCMAGRERIQAVGVDSSPADATTRCEAFACQP